MEKALNLWVEAMNQKCVPNDDSMLCQKALGLYEDFSGRFPEKKDTVPAHTANEGDYMNSGISLDWKT